MPCSKWKYKCRGPKICDPRYNRGNQLLHPNKQERLRSPCAHYVLYPQLHQFTVNQVENPVAKKLVLSKLIDNPDKSWNSYRIESTPLTDGIDPSQKIKRSSAKQR